jgi:hypothetical protein
MKNKWQSRVQNFTPMTHNNLMNVISKQMDKSRLNVPIFKNLHTDVTELNDRTSYIARTYGRQTQFYHL